MAWPRCQKLPGPLAATGGAAIGAAASILAPVGLATGALIGAGIVAYRHVNKKKNQEK